MAERPRLVVDTNMLVSRLLAPRSVPAEAVRRAADHGVLLLSESTLAELARILARPKFDPYVVISDHADWDELLATMLEVGAPEVWITHGREEALAHAAAGLGIRARALALVGYEEEGA